MATCEEQLVHVCAATSLTQLGVMHSSYNCRAAVLHPSCAGLYADRQGPRGPRNYSRSVELGHSPPPTMQERAHDVGERRARETGANEACRRGRLHNPRRCCVAVSPPDCGARRPGHPGGAPSSVGPPSPLEDCFGAWPPRQVELAGRLRHPAAIALGCRGPLRRARAGSGSAALSSRACTPPSLARMRQCGCEGA